MTEKKKALRKKGRPNAGCYKLKEANEHLKKRLQGPPKENHGWGKKTGNGIWEEDHKCEEKREYTFEWFQKNCQGGYSSRGPERQRVVQRPEVTKQKGRSPATEIKKLRNGGGDVKKRC